MKWGRMRRAPVLRLILGHINAPGRRRLGRSPEQIPPPHHHHTLDSNVHWTGLEARGDTITRLPFLRSPGRACSHTSSQCGFPAGPTSCAHLHDIPIPTTASGPIFQVRYYPVLSRSEVATPPGPGRLAARLRGQTDLTTRQNDNVIRRRFISSCK